MGGACLSIFSRVSSWRGPDPIHTIHGQTLVQCPDNVADVGPALSRCCASTSIISWSKLYCQLGPQSYCFILI